MKKILTILFCILATASALFFASCEQPDNTVYGTEENPYTLTVPSTLTVNYKQNSDPVWYEYTAQTSEKILEITVSDGAVIGYGTQKEDMSYTDGETLLEIEITADTTYYLNFSTVDLSADDISVQTLIKDKPTFELAGTYAGTNTWTNTVDLTVVIEQSQDKKSGSVVFWRKHNGRDIIERFIYVIQDEEFIFLQENGDPANTMLSNLIIENYRAVTAVSNGTHYSLAPTDPVDLPTGFEGDYVIIIDDDTKWNLSISSKNIQITSIDIESTVILTSTYTVEQGAIVLDPNGELSIYTFTIECEKITAITDTASAITYDVINVEDLPEEPDGTEANPFVINSFPSTQQADIGSVKKTWYTFTSSESGLLTITYPNSNCWVELKEGTQSLDTVYSKQTVTVEIYADTAYKLGLGVWYEEEQDVQVELTFVEQHIALPGDFEKPLSMNLYGSTSYEFEATDNQDVFVWFKYSHWNDATLTFKFTQDVNVKYGTSQDSLTQVDNTKEVSFAVEAPTVYYIGIQKADFEAGKVSISRTQVDALGSTADKPIEISLPSIVKAEGNTNSQKWYTFTATEGGYVTIVYPDANSSVAYLEENGSQLYEYCKASYTFIAYLGRTYKIGLGVDQVLDADFEVDIRFEASDVPNPGEFGLPLDVSTWGANEYDFEQTDDANKYIWYSYDAYDIGSVTVTFVGAVNVKYGETEITLQSLSNVTTLTFELELGASYYIGVQTADLSEGTISFTVEFTYKPGLDIDNPLDVQMGQNDYDLPEGKEAYFVYTPTASGTLTITVSSDLADAHIYYYASQSSFEPIKIMAGSSATIEVQEGVALYLTLSTAKNEASTGEQAQVSFTASFSPAS